MKEFHHLSEMGDSRINGRKRISQRTEIPIGYRVSSEDSERIVLEYYYKCMALFIYFTHPDNKDDNLIKVFIQKGTLVCGYSIPKEFPLIHKCKPGL